MASSSCVLLTHSTSLGAPALLAGKHLLPQLLKPCIGANGPPVSRSSFGVARLVSLRHSSHGTPVGLHAAVPHAGAGRHLPPPASCLHCGQSVWQAAYIGVPQSWLA
jgi:hypothetical protein